MGSSGREIARDDGAGTRQMQARNTGQGLSGDLRRSLIAKRKRRHPGRRRGAAVLFAATQGGGGAAQSGASGPGRRRGLDAVTLTWEEVGQGSVSGLATRNWSAAIPGRRRGSPLVPRPREEEGPGIRGSEDPYGTRRPQGGGGGRRWFPAQGGGGAKNGARPFGPKNCDDPGRRRGRR